MLRAATHGKGRQNLDKALRERLDFTTSGALKGEVWKREAISFRDPGEMPMKDRNVFMLDHMSGIEYVVWSYDTPIAWVRKGGEVVVPQVRYSRTTSRHQGLLYML